LLLQQNIPIEVFQIKYVFIKERRIIRGLENAIPNDLECFISQFLINQIVNWLRQFSSVFTVLRNLLTNTVDPISFITLPALTRVATNRIEAVSFVVEKINILVTLVDVYDSGHKPTETKQQ
jgi:hypothetical protein